MENKKLHINIQLLCNPFGLIITVVCITSVGSADRHGNALWQQRDVMAITPTQWLCLKLPVLS